MSARDIIYDHIVRHPMRRDLSLLGISTEAVTALHAAGYRILGPDEVDQVTLERAAEAAYEAITDGEHAEEVSAAVRALGRKS